ncbi:unnamed protein product [Prorocentrum cordatum]|uniref:Reverse transcriptase domain-containing protein n=1 Tax=Prorocentrum cordatum TaxID=2364126 RepID=A0ABN9YBR1_9DINO|nr:unnamed protein product [Polarella glacialis]
MASSAAAAAASGHPLALDGFDEGDFILVLYRVGGGRIWHERLILAFQTVPPFGTGVLTPDGHAYVEAIMQNGADIREYAIPAGAAVGAVAAATAGDQVYRFRGLPLPGEVATGAASVRGTLGLGAGPPIALNTAGRGIAAVVGAPAAQQPRQLAPPPLCQWRPHLHLRQEELQLSCLLAEEGRPPLLLAPLAAPPWRRRPLGLPPPPRLPQVVALVLGVRYVDFRAAVVRLHELPWGDWPLKGPRTLLWVLSFICRNGGTPLGRRTKWVSEGHLEADDPGVDIHLLCCRLLELGVVYDQLHVTNIAAMELVGRTLQTQEELYRDSFAASSEFGSDAALMSGALDAGGNACVAPALRDWLAAEKAREANIARERRKAPLATGAAAMAEVEGAAAAADEAETGQHQAIMHITDSIDELGRPPPEFMSGSAAEDGALRELLSCANLYGTGAATSTPYVSDRVAWPAAGGTPVDIVELVPPVDRVWLEGWRSHMLRDPRAAAALAREACPKGPFCDPALTRDVSTYGRFWIQMYERQMVNFAADSGMYMSTCDLECAFYHMKLPEGMEVMFTLPPIKAGVLRELGLMDLDFDPLVSLSPQVIVLPMVFSWALHLCQAAARTVLSDDGHSLDQTAQDGNPGVNVVEKNAVGVAAYVDNILVFGGCKSLVDETMNRLVGTFRRRGLPVHEIENAARNADFLGLSLRGGRYLRIKPRNVWRLHFAISSLLRRGWCSGHMIRAVLGHVEHLGSLGGHALKNPEDIQEACTLGVHGEGLGIPVEHNMTEALRFSMDPWELDEGSRTSSALTRHRAILAAKATGGSTGTLAMSLLEQQAVRLNTEAFYRQPQHTFVSYCADRHLDWSTLGQLDSILAEYLTARHLAQRLTPGRIVQPSIGAGAAFQFWGLLLHPADRGQGGMTGAFDVPIPLDLDLYLVPVLVALRLKGPVATLLWGFSLGQRNLMFFLAATTLGINHLRPHLFRMRQGGVSYDLLTQRRSMERVRRKGRWAVMSSMRRHAKETALLRELQDGAEVVHARGHLVEGRFCELLEMGFLRNWCLAQVPSQLVGAMQLCGPARGRRAQRRPAAAAQ